MNDIDLAIKAAATPKPPPLQLVTISGSGRMFGLPPNLTPPEALEIAAFLIGGTLQGMQAQTKGTVLVTPRGPVKVGLT